MREGERGTEKEFRRGRGRERVGGQGESKFGRGKLRRREGGGENREEKEERKEMGGE